MDPDDLPGVLADIAGIAGIDAALRCAARLGGPTIYMPRVYTPDHHDHMLLAGVLGDDVARAVVERIGGGMVRIPVARRERVRRAVEMVTAGAPIRRTCRELGVDDRVVRARLRRRSEAR